MCIMKKQNKLNCFILRLFTIFLMTLVFLVIFMPLPGYLFSATIRTYLAAFIVIIIIGIESQIKNSKSK